MLLEYSRRNNVAVEVNKEYLRCYFPGKKEAAEIAAAEKKEREERYRQKVEGDENGGDADKFDQGNIAGRGKKIRSYRRTQAGLHILGALFARGVDLISSERHENIVFSWICGALNGTSRLCHVAAAEVAGLCMFLRRKGEVRVLKRSRTNL